MSEVRRSHPKATVIATQPGEVKVHLADGAEPFEWYPSVLHDTEVGMQGAMLRLNQEQMAFVPYAVEVAYDGHTHQKFEVGLSQVDNTSDANKPVSTATQTALNLKADTTALTAHTGSTSNPHSVTKAQVGLANVDNTSDANKPISTATATALAGKSDTSHTHDARYYTEAEVDALLSGKSRRVSLSVAGSINGNAAITTAGTYLNNASATFSGLIPNTLYEIILNISFLASTASAGAAYLGARIEHGAGTADSDTGTFTNFATFRLMQPYTRQLSYNADNSGVIVVTPYIRWASGSVTPHSVFGHVSVE